ncbi:dihydropteroate synthase [Agaribacterium sp. ZY112]|uniref:dihydropteroate synthase n=1 Tax=Agaribacterium sp. ZY112 TaxID=3233574 RepID=UPI003525320B
MSNLIQSAFFSRPRIMAVLNVTPDSFFDGGRLYGSSASGLDLDAVLMKVEALLEDGADIIDVGGESTRPGAAPVSEEEEHERVLPVVRAIVERFSVPVSVDTSTASVMAAAAQEGAALINDVRALQRPGAMAAAVESALPVCLMHMQGQPSSMQEAPVYEDVVSEVLAWFDKRIELCVNQGLKKQNIILDPGIGFGKLDEHNLALLKATDQFVAKGHPVLIGVSRKSLLGRLLGRELDQRLAGSLALAYDALSRGATILRVHDVAETADIRAIYEFLR